MEITLVPVVMFLAVNLGNTGLYKRQRPWWMAFNFKYHPRWVAMTFSIDLTDPMHINNINVRLLKVELP